MSSFMYASGYWVSLYEEAKARGVDLEDDHALDILWSKIRHNILINSVLTSDQLLTREMKGDHFEDGYDWGMVVVLGYGIDKVMKKCLTAKEIEAVEDAMKLVVLVPRSDAPRWFRLHRLL